MTEPSDRDREMATEISAKLLSRWANDVVFERFKREISEGLAIVRAEGRREAIEESAKMADEYEKEVLPVDPGGIARLIAFRCRALAKS